MVAHVYYRPFTAAKFNTLEMGALASLFITQLLSIFFLRIEALAAEEARSGAAGGVGTRSASLATQEVVFSVLLITVNVATMAAFVRMLLHAAATKIRRSARRGARGRGRARWMRRGGSGPGSCGDKAPALDELSLELATGGGSSWRTNPLSPRGVAIASARDNEGIAVHLNGNGAVVNPLAAPAGGHIPSTGTARSLAPYRGNLTLKRGAPGGRGGASRGITAARGGRIGRLSVTR